MRAGDVSGCIVSDQGTRGGPKPTPALSGIFHPKNMVVRPLPYSVARRVCENHHYSRSYPGGSLLNFGIFVNSRIFGVAVLGVGPIGIRLFCSGAQSNQVVCLTRFWLDDCLGRNCESRALAVILRHLKKDQSIIKAVVAYSDPSYNHTGVIYRAAGFLYLGTSSTMGLYKLPNGKVYHSRSLGQNIGSHSISYLRSHGVDVKIIPQVPKFTYVAIIDNSWRTRLTRPVLSYSNNKEDKK